jgi:hypothetical protein
VFVRSPVGSFISEFGWADPPKGFATGPKPGRPTVYFGSLRIGVVAPRCDVLLLPELALT